MLQEGLIEGIYISPMGAQGPDKAKGRKPMQSLESVYAIAGIGLAGDRYNREVATGSYWNVRIPNDRRQVTFMAIEKLEEGSALMANPIAPINTRRNIFTKGIDWTSLTGSTVAVIHGSTYQDIATFKLGEECAPCDIPDSGKSGFKKAFSEWRGGIRATITGSGIIALGFKVLVLG